ncbi:MAG: leucine-rich repeat domain-containing protein [Promethearchaeota archaeon]
MNDKDLPHVDARLKEKISQLEDSLGTTFKIFTDRGNYLNDRINIKILIQNHNVTALGIFNQKVDFFQQILENFFHITHLTLFECELSTIPPEIIKLSNLQNLDLRRNIISTIPDSLCQLRTLTNLDLSDNRIAALPESILQFSSLKYLNLQNNKITALPENICTMPQLESLDVSNNEITHLLPSFSQCTSVRRLHLGGNPLVSLAGVPPMLHNHIELVGIPAILTFKGCVLAQISSINYAIQMDYELNRRNNQPPFFSHNGSLNDLPAEEISKFVDDLFEMHIMASYNLSFPHLPDIPTSYPDLGNGDVIIYSSGGVLPEFRAFLTSFLEEISNYNEDSWKEYYARHTIDLARAYVKYKGRAPSQDCLSPSQDAISQDEYERLVHECDYRLYNYLKDNITSSDPLLQALHGKFSVKMTDQDSLLL